MKLGEGITGIKSVQKTWRKIMVYLYEEMFVRGIMPAEQDEPNGEEELSLVNLVEQARLEWEQAQRFFKEVEDPDLIDHAIYALEAAERKYMYLIKLAKKERIVDVDTYRVYEKGLA